MSAPKLAVGRQPISAAVTIAIPPESNNRKLSPTN